MRGAPSLLLALAACGPSTPARAIRPPPPKLSPDGGVALGTTTGVHAEPLIVDWPSAARGKLEAQVRTGLAVVRYDGRSLQLLPWCRARGTYAYTPLTKKNDVVSLHDKNELEAKLPFAGATFAGKLATHGELRVSITQVGRLQSQSSVVGTEELDGDCDGASHVVAGLAVGAFKLFAGSSAQVGAEATVFGLGASGRSESKIETLNADGNEEACTSSPADQAPPRDCAGMIQMDLAPLARPVECPAGTERRGRACVKPAPPPPPSELAPPDLFAMQVTQAKRDLQATFEKAYDGREQDVHDGIRADARRLVAFEGRLVDLVSKCDKPDCVVVARVTTGDMYARHAGKIEGVLSQDLFKFLAAKDRAALESAMKANPEIRDEVYVVLEDRWRVRLEPDLREAQTEAIHGWADGVMAARRARLRGPEVSAALAELARRDEAASVPDELLARGAARVRGLRFQRGAFAAMAVEGVAPQPAGLSAESIATMKTTIRTCAGKVQPTPRANIRAHVTLSVFAQVKKIELTSAPAVPPRVSQCVERAIRLHFRSEGALAPRPPLDVAFDID